MGTIINAFLFGVTHFRRNTCVYNNSFARFTPGRTPPRMQPTPLDCIRGYWVLDPGISQHKYVN